MKTDRDTPTPQKLQIEAIMDMVAALLVSVHYAQIPQDTDKINSTQMT